MKIHPLTHLALAGLIFMAFVGENWQAAVAWATAWVFVITHDITIGKLLKTLKVTQLFIDAYGGKWPNKRAEDEAAKALAEFMKDNK